MTHGPSNETRAAGGRTGLGISSFRSKIDGPDNKTSNHPPQAKFAKRRSPKRSAYDEAMAAGQGTWNYFVQLELRHQQRLENQRKHREAQRLRDEVASEARQRRKDQRGGEGRS